MSALDLVVMTAIPPDHGCLSAGDRYALACSGTVLARGWYCGNYHADVFTFGR